MTTAINIHVNGRYRAKVEMNHMNGQSSVDVVEGNYEGSPNPSGEKVFYLSHPADATFRVTEEYIGDAESEAQITTSELPLQRRKQLLLLNLRLLPLLRPRRRAASCSI